uniref:hypothetical protein n=1 Tax=Enterococcus faecium TaxID=1352 RepID=UPI001E639B89
KTSKVEKEFYLRCSYLTLSVLFDKEPKNLDFWYYFFGGQYNDSLFLLDIKIPFFEKLVLIFFELFQAILHYFSRFNFFVFTE